MSGWQVEELRKIVRQTEALAASFDDEPTSTQDNPRYLNDPSVLRALEVMASHDRPMTLIVGAGASMEAGLPSWDELIDRLLREIAAEQVAEPIREDRVRTIRSSGPTAAAAVVEALSAGDDDFRLRVRNALYGGQPTTAYEPQALAQQVAWLKRQLGDQMHIATGNYDGLLERALEAEGLAVHSYIRRSEEPPGEAAVYHLHGRLIAGRSSGRIVLSDADYARVQHERSWQDGFMREALESSLCVLVGASLTDPNLIRWLYRYASADWPLRHLAIFARQATPQLPPELRHGIEKAASARWARVGVEAVFADFYGEIAQLLHEVGCRRTGASLPPFAERALGRLETARAVLLPEGAEKFRAVQDDLSELLRDLLKGVREIARAGGVDVTGERLGLALWGVNHADGSVAVWATSDRRLSEQDGVLYNRLELESRWVAVEAVTRATAIETDPRVYASRWRLIRGVPIILPREGAPGRVIVGVMTLTSMTPQAESALSRSRGVSRAVDDYLGATGALLLE